MDETTSDIFTQVRARLNIPAQSPGEPALAGAWQLPRAGVDFRTWRGEVLSSFSQVGSSGCRSRLAAGRASTKGETAPT